MRDSLSISIISNLSWKVDYKLELGASCCIIALKLSITIENWVSSSPY